MAIQLHPSLAVHAGVWLRREVIEVHGMTPHQVAAHLHVPEPIISQLLNGETGLTTDMAVRFEKAFAISADTMMRMQISYDLAQARKHVDALHIKQIEIAAGLVFNALAQLGE